MNKRWRMRDGTLIAVRNMTDTHLINAMAMCLRNSQNPDLPEGKREVASYWVDVFGAEMRLREREHHMFDDDDFVIGGLDRYGSVQ